MSLFVVIEVSVDGNSVWLCHCVSKTHKDTSDY